MGAAHGAGFVEVADRCFVARYAERDVTVGAVVGADGVLVVDTRATAAQGAQLYDDLRRVAPQSPVRWVVNTHHHIAHVLGNVAFPDATIYAHENVAAALRDGDVQTRLPDVTFSSVRTLDLGSRYVELVHPGRGHTDGDVVVRVPDAELLFAGDLIEESHHPAYGEDCFPMDWATSLDLLVGMMTVAWHAVPGHGAVVDRAFVEDQRSSVSDVGELIRSLHGQGVPLDQALAVGADDWAYPAAGLGDGVRRGYEQLTAAGAAPRPAEPPSAASRLPLA